MKKIFFSLALLCMGVVLLAGCEEVKQIVSDIAEEEIESQVNDMLGLTEEDELFQLPAAKRYEEFQFEDTDEKTTFSLAVIEPTVTVEEYAEQMIETFLIGFEDEIDEEEVQAALDQIKEDKTWSYEYDGNVITVNFEEILGADGVTIEKWGIDFEVLYAVDDPVDEEITE